MPPDTSTRLAIAIAVSMAAHASLLMPVKAPSGLFVPSLFAPSALHVRLHADAPSAETTAAPATGAEAIDKTPATPASPTPPDAVTSPPAFPLAGTRLAAMPSPSGNPARAQPGATAAPGVDVRIALPDEVNVYVHRYDAKAEENPSETIDLAGNKYFYFNAPQLKQNTRPLSDAVPQYPSRKLDHPHGAVLLLLFIDDQGKIEKTLVECANPAFEESALASVRDMRFAAAQDAKGPVRSYMKVEFRYGLGSPCGLPPPNLQQVINPAATRR